MKKEKTVSGTGRFFERFLVDIIVSNTNRLTTKYLLLFKYKFDILKLLLTEKG